jgi:hypothetical protein
MRLDAMSLRLPPYQPLPPPRDRAALLEVAVAELQPTQLCVGLAEVRSRQVDFSQESAQERRRYLGSKPVPLVRNPEGQLWMVDRHHRLRALVEMEPEARAFGYVVHESSASSRVAVLAELEQRGWLYLYDGRGQGPLAPTDLPAHPGPRIFADLLEVSGSGTEPEPSGGVGSEGRGHERSVTPRRNGPGRRMLRRPVAVASTSVRPSKVSRCPTVPCSRGL